MSHSTATLHPKPTAGPLTAATIGSGKSTMSRTMRRASRIPSRRVTGFSTKFSSHCTRSPPALKNLSPAPVSITARASGSSASSSQIRAKLRCIGLFTALAWSGRFRVTMRTAPSASTVIVPSESVLIRPILLSSARPGNTARGLGPAGRVHDRTSFAQLSPTEVSGMERLSGRGALVSGGGQGLGRAIAKRLAVGGRRRHRRRHQRREGRGVRRPDRGGRRQRPVRAGQRREGRHDPAHGRRTRSSGAAASRCW